MTNSMLTVFLSTAAIAAPLTASAPATARPAAVSPDPLAIRVWVDKKQYARGESARVHIFTRQDGYLVVLQVDADGTTRILFPAAPGNDDFVRGGQELVVHDLSGEGSFLVDGPTGTGIVYAAYSSTPFQFEDFERRDIWGIPQRYLRGIEDDPEGTLTSMVEHMTEGHFDFDIARFEIEAPQSYAGYGFGAMPGYASAGYFDDCGVGLDYGFGYGTPYLGYLGSCAGDMGYYYSGCVYCYYGPVVVLPPALPPPKSPVVPPLGLGGPGSAPRKPIKPPPSFSVGSAATRPTDVEWRAPPVTHAPSAAPVATTTPVPPMMEPAAPPGRASPSVPPLAEPTSPPRRVDPPPAPAAPPRLEPASAPRAEPLQPPPRYEAPAQPPPRYEPPPSAPPPAPPPAPRYEPPPSPPPAPPAPRYEPPSVAPPAPVPVTPSAPPRPPAMR